MLNKSFGAIDYSEQVRFEFLSYCKQAPTFTRIASPFIASIDYAIESTGRIANLIEVFFKGSANLLGSYCFKQCRTSMGAKQLFVIVPCSIVDLAFVQTFKIFSVIRNAKDIFLEPQSYIVKTLDKIKDHREKLIQIEEDIDVRFQNVHDVPIVFEIVPPENDFEPLPVLIENDPLEL